MTDCGDSYVLAGGVADTLGGWIIEYVAAVTGLTFPRISLAKNLNVELVLTIIPSMGV